MSRWVPRFLITVSSFLWSFKEMQESKNADISWTSAAWLQTWTFLVDSFLFTRSFFSEFYFITGNLSICSIILAAVAFLVKIYPFFFFSCSSRSLSSLFSWKLSKLICSEFKLDSWWDSMVFSWLNMASLIRYCTLTCCLRNYKGLATSIGGSKSCSYFVSYCGYLPPPMNFENRFICL